MLKGQMQRNWAWFDFDLKQKIIIQIIVIQSFTWFDWNIAEKFDVENGPFSSPYKRNGSWKGRKIVGTGFYDVIIGELPVQNREQTQQTWVFWL